MRVQITDRRGYATREHKTCPHCGHVGPTMHPCGSTVDLPDALALKLIRVGIAKAVRTAPVERAVKTPAETTAKTQTKPKTKASRSSRPAKEEAE